MQHQLSAAIGQMHFQAPGVKAARYPGFTSKQPVKGWHSVQRYLRSSFSAPRYQCGSLRAVIRSKLRYALTVSARKQIGGTVHASIANLVRITCWLTAQHSLAI